jgi:selenocysteine-specific elongation factor
VRGIQVHGSAADQAIAGQRTALNLAGASTDELARGMIASPPGLFRSTRRLDVQLTLLPDAHLLRNHARLHFHCYTAETIAELVLFPGLDKADKQSVQKTLRGLVPGQTAWAQLRLAEPLPLLPGDRFILRQFSPVVTIGDGVVIDAAPLSGRQQRKQSQEALASLAGGTAQEILEARVFRRAQRGLSVPDAVAETGWEMKRLQAAIATLLKEKKALLFGDVLISHGAFSEAASAAVSAVATFHQANPLVAGIGKEELRERLGLGPAVFGGMLDALVREKKIEVAGEQIHQPGRGVVMKEEEAESKRQIEHAFASAGLKVPALKEVLAGLKIDRTRAQKIVTLLLRDHVLIKVSDDLVFHHGALDSLRNTVAAFKAKSPKIDVAAFKELTGVSRKYAIPLLEYLDRERVTRRVGDERMIL